MKRILLGLLGLLVGSVVVLAGLVTLSLRGVSEAVDGPVAPGVQLVKDGYTNLFILDLDDGVALIDCGTDEHGVALNAALAARHLDAKAVKAIFVTHGHPDHVAACHLFPDAPLYAFEAERALIEGKGRSHGPLSRFISPNPALARKVDVVLNDTGVTTVGGLVVQSFLVPGHTAGSAVFFARGVLFTGDSLVATTSGTLRSAPWLFSDDQSQCIASVKGLAHRLDLDAVKVLAFAHSGSLPGSAALRAFGE